jgi:hypothetical protein
MYCAQKTVLPFNNYVVSNLREALKKYISIGSGFADNATKPLP